MPKVGKGNKAVHYPYSEKGIKDAIAHGNRTGESVTMEYGHGGMVPKYQGGGMVPKRPMPMPRPMPSPMPKVGPKNMGNKMNPKIRKALMDKMAKFKKGIL
jgi:hypothetical protein